MTACRLLGILASAAAFALIARRRRRAARARGDRVRGSDVVRARNGRPESVRCESGRDRAYVDRRDRAAAASSVSQVSPGEAEEDVLEPGGPSRLKPDRHPGRAGVGVQRLGVVA